LEQESGADAEGSGHITGRMPTEAATGMQSMREGAASLNRIEIRMYTAMGV
jgi:hypothetical protein